MPELELKLFSLMNYEGCYLYKGGDNIELVPPEGYDIDKLRIFLGIAESGIDTPVKNKTRGFPIILKMPNLIRAKMIEYMDAKEIRRSKNRNWNNLGYPYVIYNSIMTNFLCSDEFLTTAKKNASNPDDSSVLEYFVAFRSFLRQICIESKADDIQKYLMNELFLKHRFMSSELQEEQKEFCWRFFAEIYDFIKKADHNEAFNVNTKDQQFITYSGQKIRDYLEEFLADILVAIAIRLSKSKKVEKCRDEILKLLNYATDIIVNKCNNFTLFYKIRNYIHTTELLVVHKRKIFNFSLSVGKRLKK